MSSEQKGFCDVKLISLKYQRNMNIVVLLSHPAQFLFYKNIIKELKAQDFTVHILIKTKDILAGLLNEMGWNYTNILTKERGKSRFAIIWSLIKRDIKLFRFCTGKKIDLLLGSDASITHVGKLLGIPSITTLEDDYEVIKNLARLTYPFSTHIVVPDVCDVGKWQAKKISYQGYMKLSHLHPNWFTPDKSKLKFEPDHAFFIIRLSKLSAYHDVGIQGISTDLLEKVIGQLKNHGSIYISAEQELPDKFKEYKLQIPVTDIHHYLYFANMLICDSQSMAVEAAILGTPSIRFSDFAGRISVLEELEKKYQLTFGIKPAQSEQLLIKMEELLSFDNLTDEFQKRRQKMLSEKIDVASFMIWFIKNYPESVDKLKLDPDYQMNFK